MSKNFVTLLRSTFFVLLMIAGLFTSDYVMAQAENNIEAGFGLVDTNGEEADDETIKGPAKKAGQHVEIDNDFFINFAINLLIVACIIIFIYYRNYKKLDTVFTFVLFNVVIFMLTYVFNLVKFSMGAAFGLFAIFSMLRYRTTSINMKDMTYLFIFIAVGLLSAIRMDYYELAIVGALIFTVTLIMDSRIIIKRESMKQVRFDNINLILPEKEAELIADLKKRTGLNIHRVSVQDLDFLKDSALINVYYYE
jgi:hypothetical protein